MTIKSSGALSMSEINAEFSLGTNLGSYRGVTWYTDAGGSGTFSSSNLAMSEFYNKRKTAPGPSSSLTGLPPTGSYDDYTNTFPFDPPAQMVMYFYRNGTWAASGRYGFFESGNWVSPTSSTVGDSYWIQFQRTSESGFNGSSTPTSGWLQLNSTRLISAQRNTGSGNGYYGATYNISFSSNGGASTLQTLTNIILSAEHVD